MQPRLTISAPMAAWGAPAEGYGRGAQGNAEPEYVDAQDDIRSARRLLPEAAPRAPYHDVARRLGAELRDGALSGGGSAVMTSPASGDAREANLANHLKLKNTLNTRVVSSLTSALEELKEMCADLRAENKALERDLSVEKALDCETFQGGNSGARELRPGAANRNENGAP